MRAAAYGIYIIHLETSTFFKFGTCLGGELTIMVTLKCTLKCLCTINIYIMDQENK